MPSKMRRIESSASGVSPRARHFAEFGACRRSLPLKRFAYLRRPLPLRDRRARQCRHAFRQIRKLAFADFLRFKVNQQIENLLLHQARQGVAHRTRFIRRLRHYGPRLFRGQLQGRQLFRESLPMPLQATR
jgi:hypothetical protein